MLASRGRYQDEYFKSGFSLFQPPSLGFSCLCVSLAPWQLNSEFPFEHTLCSPPMYLLHRYPLMGTSALQDLMPGSLHCVRSPLLDCLNLAFASVFFGKYLEKATTHLVLFSSGILSYSGHPTPKSSLHLEVLSFGLGDNLTLSVLT